MFTKSLVVALLAIATQLPAQTSDSLRIYYVGKAVGWERYSLTQQPDKSIQYDADLDYIDRGRRNHTVATATMGADYSPRGLEVTRSADTTRTLVMRLQTAGAKSTLIRDRDTSNVSRGPNTFAIAPHLPLSQHLALLRFWQARGMPATVNIVLGATPNRVAIRRQGTDMVRTGADSVSLTRYSIDGVVWGIEHAWLDSAGRLAMLQVAGGGLSLKGVRAALVPMYDELMVTAAAAAIADLAVINARTKPIAEGSIALVGATVIDGTGRDAIPDATVIVANGRITAVGPRSSTPVPAGLRQMNVTGKTIIPGLWDSHAHMNQLEWTAAYLAAGVTTVRDMGNEIAFVGALTNFAKLKSAGQLPNLIFAGLIDGPGPNAFGALSAATPEEGIAIVRRYHDLGFTQVKLYDLLAADVVRAIADEAHKFGMIVTGHLPRALGGVRGSVNAGMDQIAHLSGSFSSDSGAALIALAAAHRTVLDPMLSWNEIGGHSWSEPLENFQPGVRQLPPIFLATRAAGWGSGVDTAQAHARLQVSIRAVGALYKAGVPIVAGSDGGVPGFSIYREMELYVKAGMTPMDALRAATSVPARAMKMDADVGTLEVGRRADLLVLDANPATDISNVRTLRWVIKDGRVFESKALWRGVGPGME